MVVKKNTKRPERRKPERQPLSLVEREVYNAICRLTERSDGEIPSLREIAREIGGIRTVASVGRIRQTLEDKGYIRYRLEIVENGTEAVA